jgi:Skp family chaperone for outer membrane proteins
MTEQRGRGRLSSLDLLPEEAQDDLIWACQQLAERQRTQADILFEFNDRLAVKGIDAVSKSAFNRKAVRIAAATRRQRETREIFSALSGDIEPARIDEHSIVLGEFLKTLIFELLQPGSAEHDADSAMKLSKGFKEIMVGQKISADRRAAEEKRATEKAVAAIEAVGKAKGLTTETVEAIKRDVLGIREDGT